MTRMPDPLADEQKADMTPMIDVVFLMIVFFVCIEFKVLEAKLTANLPRDRGSAPQRMAPVEQLSVRVHVATPGTAVPRDRRTLLADDSTLRRPLRHTLEGHRIQWEVGPKMLHDLGSLQRELQRIAADPANRLPDARSGERRLIACVVEGLRGTYYDDIARTTDACHAAGFTDIHFGGGRGPR